MKYSNLIQMSGINKDDGILGCTCFIIKNLDNAIRQ